MPQPEPQPTEPQGADFSPAESAALLVFCVLLYLANIWRGFYIDEYTTWGVLRMPVGELVENRLSNGHLPGYFLFLKLWSGLGEDEWILRFPGVVFCTLAVFAFRRFMADLWGLPAARIGAWLMTGHQLTIWTAQTARPYGPVLFAAAWGALAAERWFRTGRMVYLGWLFLAGWIGMASQALFAPTVAAMAVGLLAGWRARRDRAIAGTVMLASGPVLLVPVLRALGSEQQNFRDPEFGFPFVRALKNLSHVWLGDVSFVHDKDWIRYLSLAVAALLTAAACARLRRDRTSEFPRATLLAAMFGIPWVVLILMQGVGSKSVLSHERYYVAMLPPIVALCALGAVELRARANRVPFRIAAAAGIAIVAATSAMWLAERGDGPAVLAEQLGDKLPIVGDIRPFEYEFRDGVVRAIHLGKRESPGFDGRLAAVLRAEPRFWFVIYDNKKTKREEFLEQAAPGWRIADRKEFADARAALWERLP